MTITRRLELPHLLLTLGVLYAAGIALALASDLASVGDAIANGSKVNAPAPIIAAQLLGGLVALRAPGRWAVAGAGLLLAACTLSLAAAAFDGDIGAAGLTGAQVAYQLLISAATAATWLLALRRLRYGSWKPVR